MQITRTRNLEFGENLSIKFFYVNNKSAILGSLCIASRTNNDIVKFWDDLLNDAEIIHNENLRFGSVFDYAKWMNSE